MVEFSAAYGLRGSVYRQLMEKVLKQAQPWRDLGHNRAHVALNFQPLPDQHDDSTGILNQDQMVRDTPADIVFDIYENNLGLRIAAPCNGDLFRPEEIARILKDLEQVMIELSRNPAKRISELNTGNLRS
jgi:EAL domain-containing protein (putative c-di-GMP-specific phosphodiesterase class I)